MKDKKLKFDLQLFSDGGRGDAQPDSPADTQPGSGALSDDLKAFIDQAVKTALKSFTDVPERRGAFGPPPAQPKNTTPPEKGIRLARAVRALASAKGDLRAAAYHAEHRLHDPEVAKALAEGSGAAGGYVVPTEYAAEIIELLRAQAVVRRSGAVIWPMTTNTAEVPRLASGAQASYIGENTNIQKTEQTFGQLNLTAKKLAALVPISNDLIRDSSPAADTIVRDDLANALALREDLAFIRDDGTSNKPKGLRYWADAGNVFAANATINAANVIADLGKMVRLVRASNARFIRPVWYFGSRVEWYLRTLTDANGNFIFRDEMNQGRLLGYPFYVTTQIPENLGAGVDETEVYFGCAEDYVIGENEELLIDVSTTAAYHDGSNVVAAFSLDQTVVRAIARHDFGMRHDKSVSVLTGVKWGA